MGRRTRLSFVLLVLGASIGAFLMPRPAAAHPMDVGYSIPVIHIAPTPTRPAITTYTVRAGDNLSAIGARLHRSWQQLAGWNHLTWSQAQEIDVGQVLRIPGAGYRPQPYMPPAPVSSAVVPEKYVSNTSAPPPAPVPAVSTGGWRQPWACIAEGMAGGARWGNGESGGNPADTPGGPYYGGLQFAMSTWLNNGGVGNPAYASIAEQEAVADRVLAAAGWGQWPQTARACGFL